MDKSKKQKMKDVILLTAGGIVFVGTTILIGRQIKMSRSLRDKITSSLKHNKKFNGFELIEEGLYAFIDFDTDEIVCTIDTDDAGKFMDLLTKANNFVAENVAF